MKRFAAHYLFLPEGRFLKQHGVEVTVDGAVSKVFSLTEEIEDVEWHPGVIALLPTKEIERSTIYVSIFEINAMNSNNQCEELKNHHIDSQQIPSCFTEVFSEYINREVSLFSYLFYPFDFISMQPVDETRHKLLR